MCMGMCSVVVLETQRYESAAAYKQATSVTTSILSASDNNFLPTLSPKLARADTLCNKTSWARNLKVFKKPKDVHFMPLRCRDLLGMVPDHQVCMHSLYVVITQ